MNIQGVTARLDVRKYSFASRVVKPWNSLSKETKMAKTTNEFKSKSKMSRSWIEKTILAYHEMDGRTLHAAYSGA